MAMGSIGPVRVPTPGTPVSITTLLPHGKQIPLHGIMLQVLPGNTGNIYIGGPDMNKAALTGVYGILAQATANFLPVFSAGNEFAPNGLSSIEFWVDADVANDGVLGSYMQT